ncbi:MAG: flp 1 [Phycisphaerales bacterium]|nr:flp 1 [Phycisphaerales bacterium]
MNRPKRLASLIIPLLLTGGAALADGIALPRSSPEAQGVSSADVRAYIEAADLKVNTLHSFMLVRHGHIVAEGWWKPEAADKPHVMHSLSKSFTSTAVGLAVAEGNLNIDDHVLKFFPEDAPAEPSENLKAMRVRDLLTMTCGHETEAKFTPETPWVKTFLAQPVPFKPGTHFQYNTPGSYMLSAIVTKVTGQTVLDYLKPRLFEPLGIENPQWQASPQGISCGGFGLFIRTEDIAKFGLLYLQKGTWNGKQLLPASWVATATSKLVENADAPSAKGNKPDWRAGYGFQFWQCQHGAFRGDGANGQFCIVLPEQDAVIAITADTRDMQAEINVVWDKLLPAFHANPMAPNAAEESKLRETLAGLKAHPAVTTTKPATQKMAPPVVPAGTK